MYRIFIICLCTFTIAAVIPKEKDAMILNDYYLNNGRGDYLFSYMTSNGIQRYEKGELVNAGQDNEHIVVQGFYAYTDPGGKLRLVLYTADENGYHINSDGDSLNGTAPTQVLSAPPIIASILGR